MSVHGVNGYMSVCMRERERVGENALERTGRIRRGV